MPLATRYVEPRSVCASPLLTEEEARAGDALQAVAVRSMAGVIRQLSSLARHAESIMGELAENLADCHTRTVQLEKRTQSLIVNVLPGLDPDREVLEGFEIPHPDLQFKSDKTMDQRLLSQNHAPPALLEQYNQARAPPNLAEFNVEWGDDRNVMHIYSKPDFFFQCWRDEIQKQTLRKMSQMDMLSPKHEVDGKKLTKHKHTLEHSTGSDKVSSFVRPVKRTFSLSRRQHSQRKSIYGSTQSLNVDHNQAGYSTMPSYAGHLGISRRSSPSFHSSNHNPRKKHGPVIKSQSVRLRSKKRASLYLLTTNTASLYIEQEGVDPVLPNTTLEVSGEYEYGASRSIKKSSSIRKSHSSVQSRSKSPIPPTSTNSVLDTMHMYTVSEVIAQQESSPFALLSKFHLEHLNLGSSSFDTCLAFEPPKKEHTTFRTPLGMRQRPLSSLDMQLVAMRNDGTAASRLTSNVLRLKQISAVNPVITNEQQEPSVTDGVLLMSNGGVVLRRRLSMLGPNAQPRPVSASFIEPPTVRKLQAASRMSLQPHGGSLTDLTNTTVLSSLSFSPPMQGDGSPTSKIRPKRPAPQAPSGRPHSRTSTPESGSSTPKSFRPNSPLVKQYSNSSQSSRSSNDTLSGAINGRITPNNTLIHHRSSAVGIRPRSPIIHPPSPPHMIIGGGMHRNASSPQLPMIPIQEEDIYTTTTAEITPSSPSTPHMIINGPTRDVPPPYICHDSLYISPRKQSLTIDKSNITNLNRLRASQILETGGIQDGDLSSSRMDLLEGIRKGIQLKQVQKEEREKQNLLISMPWDVAAILERRLVMESDSETSESESNDTEWEDED